ncbi:MAG: hypothetical protein IKB67_01215 [Clostridia bacterium]|nr:hypothetical protein [Clostridia bacterium]
MQEYYKILNLTENATDEEIENAYKELKAKYSNERFCEGEVGNQAAKNLTKLEAAYHEITEARKISNTENGRVEIDFSDVTNYIKNGDITKAQQLLDDITDRNAEWHYLQSVVFYKKNWINESKKQLEIALTMEPHNAKYADELTKLKQKMEFNERQFKSGNMYNNAESVDNRQMGGDTNGCLSFCATWCCMDLLCTMCCR